MPVRRQLVIAALLIVAGVAVLALPASLEGPRIIRFGPGHGPSLLDLAGIALVVPGGLWLLAVLLRGLPALGLSARALFGLGVTGGVGLGLTVASVFGDFAGWWAVGLGAVTIVEVFLLTAVWRRA
ncbi:MAG: hypothetical protein HOV79_32825 [Hamadaea sp.]|nr:hypothetical protein [Hamadaea sp.]